MAEDGDACLTSYHVVLNELINDIQAEQKGQIQSFLNLVHRKVIILSLKQTKVILT